MAQLKLTLILLVATAAISIQMCSAYRAVANGQATGLVVVIDGCAKATADGIGSRAAAYCDPGPGNQATSTATNKNPASDRGYAMALAQIFDAAGTGGRTATADATASGVRVDATSIAVAGVVGSEAHNVQVRSGKGNQVAMAYALLTARSNGTST